MLIGNDRWLCGSKTKRLVGYWEEHEAEEEKEEEEEEEEEEKPIAAY